jgi:hypothetical protein
MRHEAFLAMKIHIVVLWDMTPFSLIGDGYQHLEMIYSILATYTSDGDRIFHQKVSIH